MPQAEHSKFIVSREDWQSTRTYHYCENCRQVIGVEKRAEPVCPQCQAGPLDDIFTIMDRKLQTVWQFVEAMRLKDGPYGRYKGYKDDPWPYRLVAADQVLSLYRNITQHCGYPPPCSREQLAQIADTILLGLNPETGLIEDPFLIKEKGRTDEVLWENYNWSRNFGSLFKQLGFEGKYTLPDTVRKAVDVLADKETALAFLEDRISPLPFLDGRTWQTNPYTKGAHVVRSIQNHQARLKESGLQDDGVVEFVHQWLDANQDPQTGYWGGQDASMNNACCGVFKILVAYRAQTWKVNYLERMVDTTLSIATPEGDFGDNGFGCTVFDPLLILNHALEEIPQYHREDIYEATARCFLNFITHWSDREHFFTPAPMPWRAELVGMHGLATPMYMAEILLGVRFLSQ